MGKVEEKNYPQLIINPDIFDLETEKPAKNYKSVLIRDADVEDFYDILKKHGKSVRKLDWSSEEEKSTSEIFDVLSLLPMLEEINLDAQDTLKIYRTEATFDLSHIRTVHCGSDISLQFFSSTLPSNCLKEFNMQYRYWYTGNTSSKSIMARFENFIGKQTSIKAFYTNGQISLNALNLLILEELKLGSAVENQEVIKVLKSQPELKRFEYENSINSETLEEVCKLSNLEVLKIRVDMIENVQKLECMKNLKQLELLYVKEERQQKIFTFKLESLEKLNIATYPSASVNNPEILETISLNFPNLKSFELNTSQKLNYFAKIFPKLEELELFKLDETWELDTGIVNEKLRKLKIEPEWIGYCTMDNIFLELFEIYPNLESLDIKTFYSCYNDSTDHTHYTPKQLFEKIYKIDKLKSINLGYFELKLEENNLMEIATELKKLAQKLKFVKVLFSDDFEVAEKDYNSVKSKYDSFVRELKQNFDVDENRLIYHELNFKFSLYISTGSKF